MFSAQNRPVCGAICDYCNTYYPNKRALTIHEYFHTSDDISTLMSYSEIFNDSYNLPKAQKSYSGGVNGMRVEELFCNRPVIDYPGANYRETKAFRISKDMEEMLYLTHKYPLKTAVNSTNRRYSPYPTENPNKKFTKNTNKTNDFEKVNQYSTDPVFENDSNNSAMDLHADFFNTEQSSFHDEKGDDDYDQDSSNSSELNYSRSDSAYDYSSFSDNIDDLEVRKSFSDSEIITTINKNELSKLCNFSNRKFAEEADLNKLEKLSPNFQIPKTFKNSFEHLNSRKDSKAHSPNITLISTETRDLSEKQLYKQKLMSRINQMRKRLKGHNFVKC